MMGLVALCATALAAANPEHDAAACITRFCSAGVDEEVCGGKTADDTATLFETKCHAACNGVLITGPCLDQSVVCPTGVAGCHRCKQTDDLKVSEPPLLCWRIWQSSNPVVCVERGTHGWAAVGAGGCTDHTHRGLVVRGCKGEGCVANRPSPPCDLSCVVCVGVVFPASVLCCEDPDIWSDSACVGWSQRMQHLTTNASILLPLPSLLCAVFVPLLQYLEQAPPPPPLVIAVPAHVQYANAAEL
jgi:hypothetical protein